MRGRTGLVAVLAVAVASVALVGSALGFSGLTNGSFEAPAGGGTFSTGSTAITGWTVSGHSVDVVAGWDADDGNQVVDLSGWEAGAISQDLATVAGETYTVTFALSGNPHGGSPIKVKTVEVSATGHPSGTYTYDIVAEGNSTADMKWREEIYDFIATGPVTTLSFTSLTADASGPVVDNVRVDGPDMPTFTVPETKDDCKKGGWQSLTDHNGTPFRNQGDCVSYVATGGRNLADG